MGAEALKTIFLHCHDDGVVDVPEVAGVLKGDDAYEKLGHMGDVSALFVRDKADMEAWDLFEAFAGELQVPSVLLLWGLCQGARPARVLCDCQWRPNRFCLVQPLRNRQHWPVTPSPLSGPFPSSVALAAGALLIP